MSFRTDKRDNLEMDELNIEFHLNASLEAKGIRVSEDLINRTLDRIKKQETGNPAGIKDKTLPGAKEELRYKKPSALYRYTRTLITAAAAVLILVAGINATRILNPSKKMDMVQERSMNDNAAGSADGVKDESAKMDDMKSYDMGESGSLGGSVDEPKADVQIADDVDGNGASDLYTSIKSIDNIEKNDADIPETTGEEESDSLIFQKETTVAFTDIAAIEAGKVEQIVLASKLSGEKKTIKTTEEIEAFYSVMEKHTFTQGSENKAAIQYVINLIGEDMDTQITIKESALAVDNTYMGIASHAIYNVTYYTMLVEDVEELLAK